MERRATPAKPRGEPIGYPGRGTGEGGVRARGGILPSWPGVVPAMMEGVDGRDYALRDAHILETTANSSVGPIVGSGLASSWPGQALGCVTESAEPQVDHGSGRI